MYYILASWDQKLDNKILSFLLRLARQLLYSPIQTFDFCVVLKDQFNIPCIMNILFSISPSSALLLSDVNVGHFDSNGLPLMISNYWVLSYQMKIKRPLLFKINIDRQSKFFN